MADRYWVGGTANWDGTAGTKWATTSGAAGGASVPTTADDVFFDASSTGPCTIATGNTGAKSINCTGFTGTITGTAAISVAGNITKVAAMTWSHTGKVTITGSGTLINAGKTFGGGLDINGTGITVELGDAYPGGTMILISGTFTTNNYNVTCAEFSVSGTATKVINAGSSTISVSSSGGAIGFGSSLNTFLTFNAGTSQINLVSQNTFLQGGGQTFYNVSFTSISSGTRVINGPNTFNNLSLTASATGVSQFSIGDNQTVNGTFTCAGTSATQRAFVRSSTIGTTRTITANAISANDCDFRDITLAGTAAGASPTRAGDCGGNSGITFPAAKTVYWNPATAQSFASASWATSSGSTTLSIDNFPLAQDTAVFDNNSRAGVSTNPSGATWNIGTIDMSNRTTAFSFSGGNSGFTVYNNWSTGTGVTISANVTYTFSGRNTTQTITSNGVAFAGSITVDNVNSTVQLADAISLPQTLEVARGTFNANGYNVTTGSFASNNSNTRTITMGSGTWTLSGTGTVWNLATTTNLTFNKDTANIVLSNTTTTARTFAGGGRTYNNLTIGGATGTSTLTITGTNTFDTLASTKTVAHTIVFPNVTTTVSNWTITGTSGNVVTLSRTGASGTFTLAKSGGGVISGVDYLSISNSTSSPVNTWYAGANSTNGGGNTNWRFTNGPVLTLVNTTTAVQNTAATTITINVPSGVINGDLLVLMVMSDNGLWTTPSGWTVWFANSNNRAIFYRTASSEPASYTITQSNSDTSSACMIACSNAAIDVMGTIGSFNSPSVAPSITTTANDAFVFDYIAVNSASRTVTTPTGFTSVASDSDSTSPSYALFYKTQATAGATGTVSATVSGSMRSTLFSIIPANPTTTVNGNFFFFMMGA